MDLLAAPIDPAGHPLHRDKPGGGVRGLRDHFGLTALEAARTSGLEASGPSPMTSRKRSGASGVLLDGPSMTANFASMPGVEAGGVAHLPHGGSRRRIRASARQRRLRRQPGRRFRGGGHRRFRASRSARLGDGMFGDLLGDLRGGRVRHRQLVLAGVQGLAGRLADPLRRLLLAAALVGAVGQFLELVHDLGIAAGVAALVASDRRRPWPGPWPLRSGPPRCSRPENRARPRARPHPSCSGSSRNLQWPGT